MQIFAAQIGEIILNLIQHPRADSEINSE